MSSQKNRSKAYFAWKTAIKKDKPTLIKAKKAEDHIGQVQPSISQYFLPKENSVSKRSSSSSETNESKKLKGGEDKFLTKLKQFECKDDENENETADSDQNSNNVSFSHHDDFPEYTPDLPEESGKYVKAKNTELSQSLEEVLEASKTQKPTPLERQVLDMKSEYPNLILMVECGYRYRFFAEDSIIASRVLDISVTKDKLFLTASVPTFNGPMKYVKRLTDAGHMVGVASQTETAATKIGTSGPFDRKVTAIYTASTLISQDLNLDKSIVMEDDDDDSGGRDINTNSTGILAICETVVDANRVMIGIASVEPRSGKIVYDEFKDDKFRTELATRVNVLEPVEVLYPKNELTSLSKDALNFYASTSSNQGRCIRMEESEFFVVRDLTTCHPKSTLSSKIPDLHSNVIKCFEALIEYLKQFGLDEVLLQSNSVDKYGETKRFMKLPAVAVSNLEIFVTSRNQRKGSLFHLLNQTKTKFGARTLRRWLSYPLMDECEILSRQNAIKELQLQPGTVESFTSLFKKMPDLELALTSALSKKIKPKDFYRLCSELGNSRDVMLRILSSLSTSGLLRSLAEEICACFEGVRDILSNINETSLDDESKTKFLKDWSSFPEVVIKKRELDKVEKALEDHKSDIQKVLGLFQFEYTSVSGTEYLIEVKNNRKHSIPDTWIKVNSTKAVSRYRDQFIRENIAELHLKRELVNVETQKAWLQFLDGFSSNFHKFQRGVACLADIDALCSLYQVSLREGYVLPSFKKNTFHITKGRNPVVETHMAPGSQYVANDVDLTTKKTLILTGPNMGGKSCFLRQTAVTCILAQMGSYVPADSAVLPIVDAVYVRMGARDDLRAKKSTLSIELEETSEAVRDATENSLVLLDELGRGTSTFDGTAIAGAVLEHLVTKNKCYTIFVTHYKPLTAMENQFPDWIANAHMGYAVSREDKDDVVLFLYKIRLGISDKSYGLNVAKLAGLDDDIIALAREVSKKAENEFEIVSRFTELLRLCLKKK